MKETLDGFMTAEQQNWRNDIIMQLAKEAKIPPARAMMTTWAQLESPNKMRTTTGREVELSNLLMSAINRLPCHGRSVFSLNPFPPTVPDEYLDPAREYIEKAQKRRFRLAWRA